jgi:hypothetical protein
MLSSVKRLDHDLLHVKSYPLGARSFVTGVGKHLRLRGVKLREAHPHDKVLYGLCPMPDHLYNMLLSWKTQDLFGLSRSARQRPWCSCSISPLLVTLSKIYQRNTCLNSSSRLAALCVVRNRRFHRFPANRWHLRATQLLERASPRIRP